MDQTTQMNAFDRQNPDVGRLFEQFTFDRIERGFPHYPAGLVLERVKFELTPVQTNQLKIKATVARWYAAKFEVAYPEHAGFFKPAARRRPAGGS